MKLYRCSKCGQVLESTNDLCDNITCCNTKMNEIKPFEVDGAKEKHIPVYEIEENSLKVKVGEVEHPMEEDHFIEFIAYECGNMTLRYKLKPNDEPKCEFPYLGKGTIYAYCNKHGLWKKDIE